MPDTCLLTIDKGIARISFNRPAKRNALDSTMHAELRGLLDRVETDSSIRVVVLAGAGGAFCSGQDLSERAAMLAQGEVDLAQSLETNFNPLVRRLVALPMPVIAEVSGVAAGAGVALALTADVVIAARSASFQLAFARVGLGPDSGTSWMMQRLIGQARAMGMALTAENIDAQRAATWGLIWRCVEDDKLATEVEQLALQLASGPQAALRAIKRRIRAAANETLDQALDGEREEQGVLGRDPDYREAVTAFMAKRRPQFR